jgi:hypothetical protein
MDGLLKSDTISDCGLRIFGGMGIVEEELDESL